jgi:hypothetical protein
MTSDDDNTNVLVEFHRIDGRGQVGNQVFAQRILTTREKLLVICLLLLVCLLKHFKRDNLLCCMKKMPLSINVC